MPSPHKVFLEYPAPLLHVDIYNTRTTSSYHNNNNTSTSQPANQPDEEIYRSKRIPYTYTHVYRKVKVVPFVLVVPTYKVYIQSIVYLYTFIFPNYYISLHKVDRLMKLLDVYIHPTFYNVCTTKSLPASMYAFLQEHPVAKIVKYKKLGSFFWVGIKKCLTLLLLFL